MDLGGALSPPIVNLFVESWEAKAIESSSVKPSDWLRYVDATFATNGDTVWTNSSFFLTMEVKTESNIPFSSQNYHLH